MLNFRTPLHRHWPRIAILAAALLFAFGIAHWLPRPAADPLLETPQLALSSLTAKSLYFNGTARPWLLAQRPELLTTEDRDAASQRARDFAQAAANPQLFRQLDRAVRFDTLLLLGDPSQYRALLDHLVETKDFTLTYVDHTCLIFLRNAAAPWSPAALGELRARLAGRSKRTQADALALVAAKLTAAQRRPEAKALLDEARALDGNSVETWSALAAYAMTRGEWRDALDATERTLQLDGAHLGAMATKIQVFYATKRYDEALALSTKLLARLPADPNVLFKHAQVAHEAHAYQTEIAALEKLITLAETERRSTTGYRLYLAQSYMASGKAQPALDEFARVLADPELPADQRKFSNESVARIKKRAGL